MKEKLLMLFSLILDINSNTKLSAKFKNAGKIQHLDIEVSGTWLHYKADMIGTRDIDSTIIILENILATNLITE